MNFERKITNRQFSIFNYELSNSKFVIRNYFERRICFAILATFLFVILSSLTHSQNIKVSATLDSNTILIGEQTKLHLTVKYKADEGNISIQWPALSDTIIKQIEIVDKSKIDTTIPDKQNNLPELEQHQTLTITSFDSGFFAIPPFRFTINNDSTKSFETEAMLLHVNTLPVDTTLAIKDIKPPMDEPFDFRELIPYIIWGAVISAVIALIVYITLKLVSRKPKPVVKVESKIPPHVTALQSLEKLRDEKLWQEGKLKEYHSALTDIIRTYIEHRFKVSALEQTSDEILYNFRSIVIDKESKEKLRQMLLLSDLVKFAKEQALPTENEMSMNNAFDFVNGTMREETKKQEENNTIS